MDQTIGVLVLVGIVGGVGSMVTVAIAETRGLIMSNGQSAGWFFFGFLVPVVAPLAAIVLPRRPHRDGSADAEGHLTTETLPRKLTAEEREVLTALLSHEDFPGRDALLAQVRRASVEGFCACGCASIHLMVQGGAPASGCPSPVPNEADVLDDEGSRIGGTIVFAHDGFLSYMEVYTNTDAQIGPLPPVERLRFRGRESAEGKALVAD